MPKWVKIKLGSKAPKIKIKGLKIKLLDKLKRRATWKPAKPWNMLAKKKRKRKTA
jgi:hypothetical protein